MLRRLFKIATAAAIGRAISQKSKTWLAIAIALLLFRFADAKAAKSGAKEKRAAS